MYVPTLTSDDLANMLAETFGRPIAYSPWPVHQLHDFENDPAVGLELLHLAF